MRAMRTLAFTLAALLGLGIAPLAAQPLDEVFDFLAQFDLFYDGVSPIKILDLRGGKLRGFWEDEVPIFWACGVTAMEAVRAAAPDLFITHAPAHMLITDRPAVGRHD